MDREGLAAEFFQEERARLVRAFPGARRHKLDQAAAALAFLRWLEEEEGLPAWGGGSAPGEKA